MNAPMIARKEPENLPSVTARLEMAKNQDGPRPILVLELSVFDSLPSQRIAIGV